MVCHDATVLLPNTRCQSFCGANTLLQSSKKLLITYSQTLTTPPGVGQQRITKSPRKDNRSKALLGAFGYSS